MRLIRFWVPVVVTTAWDTDGHQAIGMTAMSALSSKATAQVKRLMGGRDVVDVAGWAHRVEEKHPGTAPFHKQWQDRAWNCAVPQKDENNCPENACLVPAIQHFYGRLTGRPNLIQLKYPDGLKFTDSDAVKFLVNLVGDLHQPLHLGFAPGRAGRDIMLRVFSAGNHNPDAREDISLYDYWDSALMQRFIAERPATWYGGWTHAHNLGPEKMAELKKEWESEPPETRHLIFERWASESLAKACSDIYKDPKFGSQIPSGFEVSPAFDYQALEVIKNQILIAGARIALVLNTILAERDAGKLRQGSAVAINLVDSPSGGKRLTHGTWVKNFAINSVIIVSVLGIFIYVTKFYANSKAAITGQMRKDAAKRY